MIINKINITILAFLFIFAYSCKKEEENIIKGNVKELISGDPVENVRIELQANKVSSGSVSSYFQTLETKYTDNKGNFSFNFEAQTVISYRLNFSKEGFISRTLLIQPKDVVATYELNENMAYASTLELTIKNVTPQNENDKLSLQIRSLYDDFCANCCHSNWRYFLGTSIDEFISCQVIGGDTLTILRVIEKSGSTQSAEMQIYCPPGETVNISITY